MKLYSTNNRSNIVSLKEAVLNAYPKDRGLYMPCTIPSMPEGFNKEIFSLDFPSLSTLLCQRLIGDEIAVGDIEAMIKRAFDFPVIWRKMDKYVSILELFHGPSMAFKDFGARFMAELMSFYLKKNQSKRTILVATSGDTGGAVAAGFYGIENIDVVILYPSGKVSPLQEEQLTRWDKNISAVEINGSFDDCQRLVKSAFLDQDLNSKYSFSSANSINIARLIPQSFYYFEAYRQSQDIFDKLVYVVPSGNFGNLTAGFIAREMGLPVHGFIAACNANDTFPSFLNSGHYNARNSKTTLSNAMDVGDPSNFARLDALFGSTWNMAKRVLQSFSINDAATVKAMKDFYKKYKYILDPHTAVAYACVDKMLNSSDAHYILLETAHPVKFNSIINKVLNKSLDIPDSRLRWTTEDKSAQFCSSDFADFKELLMFDQ